jgi:hypothetical protein
MYFLTVKFKRTRLCFILYFPKDMFCLALQIIRGCLCQLSRYECHPKNFGDAQGAAQGSW